MSRKNYANTLYGTSFSKVFDVCNTKILTNKIIELNNDILNVSNDNSCGLPSAGNSPYYTIEIPNLSNTFTDDNEPLSIDSTLDILIIGYTNKVDIYDLENNVGTLNIEITNSNNFGKIVEINRSNSNMLAVGSDDFIYIYLNNSGSWTEYATINLSGQIINGVSYSENTIVVTTNTETTIFTDDENGSFQGISLQYNGIQIAGNSVSISENADKIVVGVPNENIVYYFLLQEGEFQFEHFFEGDTSNNDKFGWVVKISSDGYTILYSDPENDNDKGMIRVYETNELGTGWTKVGEDLVGVSEDDRFGYSLDVSANADNIIIGAPQNSDNGYIKIFSYNDSDWEEIANTIGTEAQTGITVSIDKYNGEYYYSQNNDIISNMIMVNQYQLFDVLTFPHNENETGEEAQYYIVNVDGDLPILRPITLGTGYIASSTEPREFTNLMDTEYNLNIYFDKVGTLGEGGINNEQLVNGVTIVNGGKNYSIDDIINVMDNDHIGSGGVYVVKNVDNYGAVTEVYRCFQGNNYNPDGNYSFVTDNIGTGIELNFSYVTSVSITISDLTTEAELLSKYNSYYLSYINSSSSQEQYSSILNKYLDSLIESWVSTILSLINGNMMSIPNFIPNNENSIMETPISTTSLSPTLISIADSDTRAAINSKFKSIEEFFSDNLHLLNQVYKSFSKGKAVYSSFIKTNMKELLYNINSLKDALLNLTAEFSMLEKELLVGTVISNQLEESYNEVLIKLFDVNNSFINLNNNLLFLN